MVYLDDVVVFSNTMEDIWQQESRSWKTEPLPSKTPRPVNLQANFTTQGCSVTTDRTFRAFCDRCRVSIREGVEGVACIIPARSGRAGGQNYLFCFLLKKPCNASGGVHPPKPPRREVSTEVDAWEQAHRRGGLEYLFVRLGEIRQAREEAEWAGLVRTLPEPIRFNHVEDVSIVEAAGWTCLLTRFCSSMSLANASQGSSILEVLAAAPPTGTTDVHWEHLKASGWRR